MRFARRQPLLGLALVVAWAAAQAALAEDPRSVVLFEQRCDSDRGSHVVTLFANGTIRLKETVGSRVVLHLAELTPEDLGAYRAQLLVTDPSDGLIADRGGTDIGGLGVERCVLVIAAAGRAPVRHVFSPLSVPSLRIDRWLRLAEDLAQRARPKDEPETLDEDYEPHLGDILRDVAGQRYRVVWVSVEGWVELDGIDQAIHVETHVSALGERFVALVEAADGGS